MPPSKPTPEHTPHIAASDLDEVLAEAAHLKNDADRPYSPRSAKRNNRPWLIAGAVALGVLVTGLATKDRLTRQFFPLDPVTAALTAETLRIQALDARLEHHYDVAEKFAAEAVDIDPKHFLALNELALAYEGQKRYDKATAVFERALGLAGTQRDAAYVYFNLAHLLDDGPRKVAALAYYKQALVCRADFAPAQNYLGLLYERLGQPEKALEYYAATLKSDQTYRGTARISASYERRLARGLATLAQAQTAFKQGNTTQALTLAHAAVKAYPGNTVLLRDVGLAPDGDYKHAEEESEKLWKEADEDFDAKRYEKALWHAEEAVAIDPDNYKAQNLLGMSFKRLGRFDEAEAAYRTGMDIGGLTKANYYTYYNLGVMLKKGPRKAEVLELMDQVLSVVPKEDDAYYIKGQVYEGLNRIPEALQAYHDSLMIKWSQEATDALKRLRATSGGHESM
jgi:tetratricopeptide (TPR) repeat protein